MQLTALLPLSSKIVTKERVAASCSIVNVDVDGNDDNL